MPRQLCYPVTTPYPTKIHLSMTSLSTVSLSDICVLHVCYENSGRSPINLLPVLNLAFLATWRFNPYLVFSVFFVSLWLNLHLHFRRLSPVLPLRRYPKYARGGHTRSIRCNCAISAASVEPTALQKCQFGGLEGASRRSFQRKYCNFRTICTIGDISK